MPGPGPGGGGGDDPCPAGETFVSLFGGRLEFRHEPPASDCRGDAAAREPPCSADVNYKFMCIKFLLHKVRGEREKERERGVSVLCARDFGGL